MAGRRILSLLVVTSLLAPAVALSKIYKIVDEDGNVSYTDVAPTDAEKRDKSALEFDINNTYKSNESNPTSSLPPGGESAEDPDAESAQPGDLIVGEPGSDTAGQASAGYNSVTITSPPTNASLRSNSGDINLGVRLDPSLRPGDRVRFFLDGKPVGTVIGTSMSLTNVDRGTHTIAAVVLDSAGKPRKSSPTQTFTLQRYAPKLAPAKPKSGSS